jgi:hypothetical protein
MPTFANGETNTAVRTKINDAIEYVDELIDAGGLEAVEDAAARAEAAADRIDLGDFDADVAQVAADAAQTALDVIATDEARDAAVLAGAAVGSYPSTVTGLAGTTNGEYFWVAASGFLTLYLNSAGTAVSQSVSLLTGDSFGALYLPAHMFSPISNASTDIVIKQDRRLPYWTLPKASDVFLGIALALPAHWNTMTCEFQIISVASASGNVSLGCETDDWVTGDDLNVSPTGGATVIGAMATGTNFATLLTTSAFACDATKMRTMRIRRNRSSGSDTYASDIGLIGITLRRVS